MGKVENVIETLELEMQQSVNHVAYCNGIRYAILIIKELLEE